MAVGHYEILDAAYAGPVAVCGRWSRARATVWWPSLTLASEAVRAAVDIRHCVAPGGLVGEFFMFPRRNITGLTSGADGEKAFAVVRMTATHVPPFGLRHACLPAVHLVGHQNVPVAACR